MDYNLIYKNLILKAKNRTLEGYKERHHIIPKCVGGANTKDNLVELTAREHFIAHKLLCKIYPTNNKIFYALYAMAFLENKNQYRYKISSRDYEYLKTENSKNKSIDLKGRVFSEESKQKMSKAKQGSIPWNKGLTGYRKGIHLTEEHKLKIRKANSGKIRTEETKKKLSESKTGILHPKYGTHISDAHRTAVIKSNSNRIINDSTRQKMSEARKKYHLNKQLKKELQNGTA
jgi:hypothetical protein